MARSLRTAALVAALLAPAALAGCGSSATSPTRSDPRSGGGGSMSSGDKDRMGGGKTDGAGTTGTTAK